MNGVAAPGLRDAWWRAGLLALLTLAVLASRTLMPVDETRYLAVAWEMWQRGDFLVPFRNGEPYSHKPPLMFWMFHAGWAAAGVNDITPRLVSPLLGLATLWVTGRIAAALWPDAPWLANRAAWILLGSMLFALFSEMVMFDVLLTLCVAVGVLGLALAPTTPARGFGLLALGIGTGVLGKGPAVLLHLLPAALLAPWWLGRGTVRWPRWYAGVALALVGGAAIALAWAIPAGLRGGDAYRNAIFWGQTANRMVESFAHQRPLWWYLPWLPLILAPWFAWLPFWRGARSVGLGSDRGARLALTLLLPTLIAFSLVSGKQVHYLLPQFPAFAVLAARCLEGRQPAARPWFSIVALALLGGAVIAVPYLPLRPAVQALATVPAAGSAVFFALAVWMAWSPRSPERQVTHLCTAWILALAATHLLFMRPLAPAYDVRPIAQKIAELQAQGRPVGHDGNYHAQFQFIGRLDKPLVVLDENGEAERWARLNPNGALVLYFRPPHDPSAFRPLVTQPYRGRIAALFEAADALPALAESSTEVEPDDEAQATKNPRPRPPK